MARLYGALDEAVETIQDHLSHRIPTPPPSASRSWRPANRRQAPACELVEKPARARAVDAAIGGALRHRLIGMRTVARSAADVRIADLLLSTSPTWSP